ncbi:hypothetical protein OH77DRAFT_1421143 [Trametes cingulata]|nr:hypothetical protein OH77DRAFT_1421143 [Trametes cingulata]
MDDFDFPIQQWPGNDPPSRDSGRNLIGMRARGRGRGAYSAPGSGNHSPHRGYSTPRGRGRGRGDSSFDDSQRTYGHGRGLASKLQAGAPLSRLLYEDRPLLRPITFVRSVYTATLFMQEEDIFKPVVEPAVEGDEKSHLPTADTVSRVFHLLPEGGPQSSSDEEELEEIDFADIGRIQAEVDAAAANTNQGTAIASTAQDSAAFFVDTTPAPILTNSRERRIEVNKLQGALGEAAEDDEVIVYVAPHPRHDRATPSTSNAVAPVEALPSTSIITGLSMTSTASPAPQSKGEPSAVPPASRDEPTPGITLELGTLYPEESILAPDPSQMGVAPDASDLPPPPSFDSISFSFEKKTVKKQTRRVHPVGSGTPRSLLKRSRKARRKSLRGFGAYGAMHEEARLHEVDPRRDEQRRGDSDINWGDSDEDEGVDELSQGIADMEIDENVSLEAMKRFVHSMSAEGSQHVTMDDVADMERMRREDEEQVVRGAESADEGQESDNEARSERPAGTSEGESESDDEEVEAVVAAEEAMLIGESGDEGGKDKSSRRTDGRDGGQQPEEVDRSEERQNDGEDDDEDEDEDEDEEEESSDEDETPKRGFQTRLERLRARSAKGKGKAVAAASDSDDSSDEAMSVQMTWADEDEDYFDEIEAILEENQHILLSRDRKAKKELFTAIRDGQFERDMFADMMAPAKRAKEKDVPPELRDQWEKDRQKKAENKRKRALERMKLAADPLATHKGGKKGRKAMLAAARAADDADLPNRITDLVTLEQQIRRFLADIGGRDTMALPPCDKETRKKIHELAGAFNLKSQSKGSGQSRYTTLIKTSKSGIGINERKIRRILKQATNGTWEGPESGRGRSKAVSLAKHREGEEVGKAAPKIGESNIGFKMLAAMGWSDGDRIGLSGGLEAPLTAIMKKTKLGLGATLQ